MKTLCTITLALWMDVFALGQSVPAEDENIPYLVTFGADGETSWGDDDFSQVFFFSIPETYQDPVYIRVYDPDTGGQADEKKGNFNTKTTFTIYGGKGCITEEDARGTDPIGEYNSGNVLASQSFTTSDDYDEAWYTFGPFNPTSGELSEEYGGYIIKIIAEGASGDDGNLYKYYLSTGSTGNVAVEGANAFTFEYTFRLHDDPAEVSHVYPYVDELTISVKQSNYDWDYDGDLKFVSNSRHAVHLTKSGNGNWGSSEHDILATEKESSLDVQFHKDDEDPKDNNNIGFFITNQYGEFLPFYTIPIGGIPKPPASINLIPKD